MSDIAPLPITTPPPARPALPLPPLASILALALLLLVTRPLGAATSADLVGDWVVNFDATWTSMAAKLPQMASLTPDQLALVKSEAAAQIAGKVFTFTTTSLISTQGKDSQSEAYVVAKTDGDTLYTDDTSADGKVTHSRIDVTPTQLTLTDVGQDVTVVLQRK